MLRALINCQKLDVGSAIKKKLNALIAENPSHCPM